MGKNVSDFMQMLTGSFDRVFIGEYICQLDQKGRFRIPKRYRERLDEYSAEKKRMIFAGADFLRVYPQEKIGKYIEEIQNHPQYCEKQCANRLIRATFEYGSVNWLTSGMAAIPEIFMKQYGLVSGMELLLQGQGEYFEIKKHEKYVIQSKALRKAVDMETETISELDIQLVTDIKIENEELTTPEDLRRFENLTNLTLNGCGIDNLDFLCSLHKLKRLFLRDNQINDFFPISEISELEILDISGNPLSSLKGLEKLENLACFTAADCRIREMPVLPENSQLSSITLRKNQLDNVMFLKNISGAVDVSLKSEMFTYSKQYLSLDLADNHIWDLTPLSGVKKIHYLHVANNPVENIEILLTLPVLQTAIVDDTLVSECAARKLLIHTTLNSYNLTVLSSSAYESKRESFNGCGRYRKNVQRDETILTLLFDLIFIRRVDQVFCEEDDRYMANASYPLTENKKAFEVVLSMENCWEKQKILEWIDTQKPVIVPTVIDEEYCMSPGRSGSLRFTMTPGGGFVGSGEPYTIDRSEYMELDPYKR